MGERKRSHGADDENLARRAPCYTRHGGWRFPRRDGKQHLGPNEADERTDANGLQPRRKHYRPQRSSAFRDHADELLVSKHAKKQRVFDLERRYFNELLPVRENVHLFILLVFLRWFGRCIEWKRDQLRQGCLDDRDARCSTHFQRRSNLGKDWNKGGPAPGREASRWGRGGGGRRDS